MLHDLQGNTNALMQGNGRVALPVENISKALSKLVSLLAQDVDEIRPAAESMGYYYYPPDDGLSYHEWLGQMAKQLIKIAF